MTVKYEDQQQLVERPAEWDRVEQFNGTGQTDKSRSVNLRPSVLQGSLARTQTIEKGGERNGLHN